MKRTIALLAAAVLLGGCAYNYPYSHVGGATPPQGAMPTSQYTVVNSSGYPLSVYQDGAFIGTLELGQVQPIKGAFLWTKTVITVTGMDNGVYVGSDSYVFECGVPEAWTVVKLNKPQHPR